MDSFKGADPAVFSSNFQGIPKAVCGACHTQGGASDNCLTCHDYHIGKVMPALTSAPMRIQDISGKGK